MITENDLKEAIAECQGVRHPDASTCLKLASYLTIQKEMYGDQTQEAPRYSFATEPMKEIEKTIDYDSDTEFARAINGRDAWEIWSIIDEAMDALQVLNPQLYKSIMRKIEY